ncbi:MAG: NAD(+) synthase [Spirochaetae bacterium HGW-Spirochaetae-1]|jgi:NAD+ synthase|nr:MAG: NAD(+) synthase [Spirochaetae bacterium HGW-Spirochaetae-1]
MSFNLDILKIDPVKEVKKISDFLIDQVQNVYKRTGIVVGLSGGIDSAVMAALSVEALGKDKVVGLILPEKESNPISSQFAEKHAKQLGIEYRIVDISKTVDSVVGYTWRDEYIKKLVPEFQPGYKFNITLPTDLLERDAFNFYKLQVQLPDGTLKTKRLNAEAFHTVTAFASIKIRARMINLYWEAERRSMVVAGTTNRTEMILGDFCKFGDGGNDMEALSYLYKNQIYQISRYLNVISEIIDRAPSPDTFSLPVTDQEFFFRIDFDKLDHLLYAWEHGIDAHEAAKVLDLSSDAVERAYRDFRAKNRATAHLREMPHELKV